MVQAAAVRLGERPALGAVGGAAAPLRQLLRHVLLEAAPRPVHPLHTRGQGGGAGQALLDGFTVDEPSPTLGGGSQHRPNGSWNWKAGDRGGEVGEGMSKPGFLMGGVDRWAEAMG